MPASSNRRLPIPLLLAAAILLPLLGLFAFMMRDTSLPENADARELPGPRDKMVVVGGVSRPASDLASEDGVGNALTQEDQQKNMVARVSIEDIADQLPLLKKSMNVNVRNTLIAHETDQNPERLTPLAMPGPFDLQAYKKDPQAYLDVVEPGRVFQSAPPGPSVKAMGAVSPMFQTIKPQESVRLKVLVTPESPVSFTSFDSGAFQNHLPSITVVANQEGQAEAVFTATYGTVDRVNILSSSPVTSGRASFVITVTDN